MENDIHDLAITNMTKVEEQITKHINNIESRLAMYKSHMKESQRRYDQAHESFEATKIELYVARLTLETLNGKKSS